ncbi:uncharacterized protein LOC143466092 [Clavelina lepadiformis]|uniref:PNT domain-containing protein n=1 Tax=Clavelina lepadiformis TaxID=159417 RepID=A0ABP0EVW2_CLALP
MTARNGPDRGNKPEKGFVLKRKTWRQRRHDNLKKRKKIRKWTKNWLRKAGSIKVEANVAGVTGSNKKMEMTNKNGKLPIDPMNWEPNDVTNWVETLSKEHHFSVDRRLFMMNGKGLCFMSLNGFIYRSPDGGALLHADLHKKILERILYMRVATASGVRII